MMKQRGERSLNGMPCLLDIVNDMGNDALVVLLPLCLSFSLLLLFCYLLLLCQFNLHDSCCDGCGCLLCAVGIFGESLVNDELSKTVFHLWISADVIENCIQDEKRRGEERRGEIENVRIL